MAFSTFPVGYGPDQTCPPATLYGETFLADAKAGQVQGFTAYVEDAHGYHRSLWAFEGSLKAVGMADMLKHDIMNFIKAAS
jgi:hypothetical protein